MRQDRQYGCWYWPISGCSSNELGRIEFGQGRGPQTDVKAREKKKGKKEERRAKIIIIFVLRWGAAIPELPNAGATRQYPAVERSNSFLEEKCMNMGLSGGLYAI